MTNAPSATNTACTPEWVKPLALEEIGRIAWCIEATFRALKSGDHESAMYNVRYCDQGAATEIARLEWAIGKARGR
jgi:hypothetical protein